MLPVTAKKMNKNIAQFAEADMGAKNTDVAPMIPFTANLDDKVKDDQVKDDQAINNVTAQE